MDRPEETMIEQNELYLSDVTVVQVKKNMNTFYEDHGDKKSILMIKDGTGKKTELKTTQE